MLIDGKQMHIQIKKGDIGRYVILPGDPARCEKIARYFDESQKPLTFDIQYPRINPDTGELEYVLVQVPKIALVPMNSLKLKEMKLKFKVKLSSWDDGKSNDSGLLANILSSNRTDTDNFVDVELLFESNDPPEAVMKINDQMVKILP